MYEINTFITSDLNELRNSNQTDWISLACDQALQFWREKRSAREQASGEAAFLFVWGFRVTSRDSPINFVIVRWRHAREQASGEAAFPFVWGFRVSSRDSPIHFVTVCCPEANKGSPKYIKPLTFNLAELPNSVAKLWLTDDNVNKGSDWLWLHSLTVLSHDDVRSQLLSWLKFTLVTEPSWPTTGKITNLKASVPYWLLCTALVIFFPNFCQP